MDEKLVNKRRKCGCRLAFGIGWIASLGWLTLEGWFAAKRRGKEHSTHFEATNGGWREGTAAGRWDIFGINWAKSPPLNKNAALTNSQDQSSTEILRKSQIINTGKSKQWKVILAFSLPKPLNDWLASNQPQLTEPNQGEECEQQHGWQQSHSAKAASDTGR